MSSSPHKYYSDDCATQYRNGDVTTESEHAKLPINPRKTALNPNRKRKSVNKNSVCPTYRRRIGEVRHDVREREHQKADNKTNDESFHGAQSRLTPELRHSHGSAA